MGVVMISRRNVGDFDSWKPRFESQSGVRAEHGATRVRRFQGLEDPNETFVLIDWESEEQGRAFVAKKMAERPGLADELDFFFARELPVLES